MKDELPAILQVVIPHRSPRLTRAALKHASTFANGLDVRIRLIDVRVAPYGVPVDKPMANLKQLERRLKHLSQSSTLRASAEVITARDWEHGLRRVLSPGSIVLMAIKRPGGEPARSGWPPDYGNRVIKSYGWSAIETQGNLSRMLAAS